MHTCMHSYLHAHTHTLTCLGRGWGGGKPRKTLQSSDRLYKAPTDYTKLRQTIQSPKRQYRAPKRLYKTFRILNETPKILDKYPAYSTRVATASNLT